MTDEQEIVELLERLRQKLPAVRSMSTDAFDHVRSSWLATTEAMKNAVFRANPKQANPDRRKFEYAAGAQSIQFMVDLLPFLHARMTTHYDRFRRLKLLDVGAGSGAGSHLLARLHSDTMIWSRLDITAIDYVDWRRRWVAVNYPEIDYRVMAASELPDREWDFVICSHVVEHLDDPCDLIAHVIRACRGFAFVYAPYNEVELGPGHRSTITEATFSEFDASGIHYLRSMGYYGEGRECILAIFDCRSPPGETGNPA